MKFPKTIKCTECEGKCIRVLLKPAKASYECTECCADFTRARKSGI